MIINGLAAALLHCSTVIIFALQCSSWSSRKNEKYQISFCHCPSMRGINCLFQIELNPVPFITNQNTANMLQTNPGQACGKLLISLKIRDGSYLNWCSGMAAGCCRCWEWGESISPKSVSLNLFLIRTLCNVGRKFKNAELWKVRQIILKIYQWSNVKRCSKETGARPGLNSWLLQQAWHIFCLISYFQE